MNAIAPNSISMVPKEPVKFKRPILTVGSDKEFPHGRDWPRVYHKYLNTKDKLNIYGEDVTDISESNVVGLEVLPLNAQQEDFLDSDIDEKMIE